MLKNKLQYKFNVLNNSYVLCVYCCLNFILRNAPKCAFIRIFSKPKKTKLNFIKK